MPPVPFAYQAYQSNSLPFSAQRLINLFAEPGPPEAKNRFILFNDPGIDNFVELASGPIRGGGVLSGKLYVVSGETLFRVEQNGNATDLGTIPGIDRVQVDSNGLELMFLTAGDGYLYDTINGLRQITDPDFPIASSLSSQDGVFIVSEKDSARWYISAQFDGSSWLGTDFGSADGSPDNLVALKSNHREVWLFGETSIEVWYNAGTATGAFPFQRINGIHIERGLKARQSLVLLDNTLYWLGDDGIVYRANGYNPQRVSTHAIETAIENYSDVTDAFGVIYDIAGHKHYVLTFPSGPASFVYDVATGLWHERESRDQSRWIGNTVIEAYNKKFVGAYNSGKFGPLNWDIYTEFGELMIGETVGPAIHGDKKTLFFSKLEMDIEAGVGLNSGQGSDPEVILGISDDGGRTYKNLQPRRLLGKQGQYKTRLRWLRQGRSRERVWRLIISDPVKKAIINAHADWSVGTS